MQKYVDAIGKKVSAGLTATHIVVLQRDYIEMLRVKIDNGAFQPDQFGRNDGTFLGRKIIVVPNETALPIEDTTND